MERHVTGRALTFTFAALVLLTISSWALSTISLGDAEFAVAIAIAGLKAALVLIFFMHLIEEGISTLLALLSGIFFVLLLATWVAAEVATRATPPLIPAVESSMGRSLQHPAR